MILTGTPTGSTVVSPGDLVEVEVSAGPTQTTGWLRSPVAEADYEPQPARRHAATRTTRSARPPTAPAARPAPADSAADLLAAVGARCRPPRSPPSCASAASNRVTLDRLQTTRPSPKMAGFARTLRYVPFREDLFASTGHAAAGSNAQKRAVEQVRPGEILVIEARGDPTAGHRRRHPRRCAPRSAARLGHRHRRRDPRQRDAWTSLDIPVYYAAVHPAVLGRRHVPWETNVTVACAGRHRRSPATSSSATPTASSCVPRHARHGGRRATPPSRSGRRQFIAALVAKGESVDGLYPIGEAVAGLPTRPGWKEKEPRT